MNHCKHERTKQLDSRLGTSLHIFDPRYDDVVGTTPLYRRKRCLQCGVIVSTYEADSNYLKAVIRRQRDADAKLIDIQKTINAEIPDNDALAVIAQILGRSEDRVRRSKSQRKYRAKKKNAATPEEAVEAQKAPQINAGAPSGCLCGKRGHSVQGDQKARKTDAGVDTRSCIVKEGVFEAWDSDMRIAPAGVLQSVGSWLRSRKEKEAL